MLKGFSSNLQKLQERLSQGSCSSRFAAMKGKLPLAVFLKTYLIKKYGIQ